MGQTMRDLICVAVAMLSFPLGIHLTHVASSEGGEPGERPAPPPAASAGH